MAVIEVEDLVKRYGDTAAVDDVSFAVERGEIFGILGPNGAGKTTTVECVEGLRTPNSGAIRGLRARPAARRRAAPAASARSSRRAELPDKLRVGEALELYSSFYRDAGRLAGAGRNLGPHRQARHRSSASCPAGRSSGCRSRSR